ncbi:MAG: RNA 2',3'-cyclic phosphodiesterase [Chloroflexi bacterium]|nr:RNA 2',3'-cyclic phosphodiesterase [Chloroflexota bacterium]
MPESIRSFIAIELPDEARELLAAVQEALRRGPGGAWVRWVEPQGIHLTLKFLGNVPSHQIAAVAAAAEQAAAGLPPFLLATGELEVFPRPAAPRVIWLGVGGQVAPLGVLQQRVEQALVPLGFAAEARPFTPHLTLGRVREGAPAEMLRALGQVVAQHRPPKTVSVKVLALTLMRSHLTPAGAVYTPLTKIQLSGN